MDEKNGALALLWIVSLPNNIDVNGLSLIWELLQIAQDF